MPAAATVQSPPHTPVKAPAPRRGSARMAPPPASPAGGSLRTYTPPPMGVAVRDEGGPSPMLRSQSHPQMDSLRRAAGGDGGLVSGSRRAHRREQIAEARAARFAKVGRFFDGLSLVLLPTRRALAMLFPAFEPTLALHRPLYDPPPRRLGVPPSRNPGISFVDDMVYELAQLPASPKVLDAGCGFGSTLMRLHELAGHGLYDGITISKVQRNVATDQAARIKSPCHFYTQSYDDAAPHPSYDLVVGIESLTYSPDLGHTLTKLADALKTGGRLIVVDDVLCDDLHWSVQAASKRLHRYCKCDAYSEQDYWLALRRAGLVLEKYIDLTRHVRHPPRYIPRALLIGVLQVLYHIVPVVHVRSFLASQIGWLAKEALYEQDICRYLCLVARKAR